MLTAKIGAIKKGTKQWIYCYVKGESLASLFDVAKDWMESQDSQKLSITLIKGGEEDESRSNVQ